ncbi:MAG: hypothetical protein MUC36_06375 [Planctomycetes bacterium]|jgi:hypothetical protein|nr:hypothetical protein [Planctomycetota bacterium]
MAPLLSIGVVVATSTWWLGGGMQVALLAVAATAGSVFVIGWRAARGALPKPPLAQALGEPALAAAASRRVAELHALGFEPVGEAFTVNQATPGVVVPLVHRRRGVLAAVYEFPGGRSNTDLVTPFADGGMLTTAAVHEAGLLPLPEAIWMQIAVAAPAAELLRLHEQGLAFARGRGRVLAATATLDAPGFVALVLDTLRQQRARFDRAPLRTTAVMLWRLLTGRSPYRRPVQEQHGGGAGTLGAATT